MWERKGQLLLLWKTPNILSFRKVPVSNDLAPYKTALECDPQTLIYSGPSSALRSQLFTTVIKSALSSPPRVPEAMATNYQIKEQNISWRKVIILRKCEIQLNILDNTFIPNSCAMVHKFTELFYLCTDLILMTLHITITHLFHFYKGTWDYGRPRHPVLVSGTAKLRSFQEILSPCCSAFGYEWACVGVSHALQTKKKNTSAFEIYLHIILLISQQSLICSL